MTENNATSQKGEPEQLEKTMKVLADIEDSKKGSKYPPVEQWNPDVIGQIDIRIDREGDWYYQGDKMARKEMVKLFSSILRLDDDGYCLVTPVEKMKITVDVAPFSIVDFSVEKKGGQSVLLFKDSVGEDVILDKAEQLKVSLSESGEPIPLLTVRRNLKGLINRNVFYRLVEIAEKHEVKGRETIGIWSSGVFFPLQ